MVLPGTCAILLFQDADLANLRYTFADGTVCENLADCTDAIYPMLLFNLLPKGILGLVLAGLLAAMMSSVSATFNSASTLITMDFVKQMRPNLTSEQLVRVGQIATLVLVVLASLWAPLIEKAESLFQYLQDVLSYIAPPVAATFLVGLFWKKANATGSIVSLGFGFLFSVVSVISKVFEISPALNNLHFLYRTVYLFLACALVHFIVSGMTAPPPAEKVKLYTWKSSMIAEETAELASMPWYLNYRYQSVLLLIITAIVVGYFW